MNSYKQKFLLVFITYLFSNALFAQNFKLDSSYKLIAVKDNFRKTFRTGTKFFVKFYNDSSVQKYRGVFTGITNDKIIITTHKKEKVLLILPENILLLRKIKPVSRIIYAGVGTILVTSGAIVLNNSGNTPASAIQGAFLIPVIGIGTYFLFAIPASLLIEKLGEKKKVDGWAFKIEKS